MVSAGLEDPSPLDLTKDLNARPRRHLGVWEKSSLYKPKSPRFHYKNDFFFCSF